MKNRAYKFRIYPNKEQQDMLAKTFGCVRFIYNRMLEDKMTHYKETGEMLRNTPAQYMKEYTWLKEVDSLALANAQLHLDRAYKNFFNRPETGFPKYKSKHRNRMSYTTNVVNGNIRLEEGRLRLPKVGKVRIIVHRAVPENGTLKSVTVSKAPSGKYYAGLLYVLEETTAVRKPVKLSGEPFEKRTIGLDFSMHGLYKDSHGNEPDYPRYYRQSEEKLKREQRKLSKMEKGSRNR